MIDKINDFAKILKEKGLDGFIATNPVNIFYLTGFRGFSPAEREVILVFSPKPVLITSKLYQQEANRLKSKSLKVAIADERNRIHVLVKKLLAKSKKVGFEENDLKYSEYRKFKKDLTHAKLAPFKNLVEDLRSIKSNEEIHIIERAQVISQEAFGQLIKILKPGQTEQEIAEKLSKIIKTLGGQGLAFESIIASGLNSSKPHHVTSNRRLRKNDILLLDFGAKYKDYCADLTRTIFLGKSKDEQVNIWHHVFKAQQQAINKIEQGLKSAAAFDAANNHFKKLKLKKYFLHSLGHGIGLEVHEKPSLSLKSKDILKENMVFSVEPGLYFPKWGGIRIEDLVVIKNSKAKILGKTSQLMKL